MCQWWMRRHILPVASTRWGKKKKRCWFEDVIPAPFSHRYVVVSWEMNNVKSIYNKWRWCKLLRLVLLRPSKQEVGGMRWRWGNNVVSSKLSVVPAFSFVMDILLFDKWKQIAWCRRLNGRELGSVKPAAERRWSQSLRFFCGRLRPDWSQHKVLVEEKEKGRTGFRQAAVKLGELTMAALFVAADMGWRWGGGTGRLSDSPETALSLSRVTTNWVCDRFPRPDMTLCRAKENKQATFFKVRVVTPAAVCVKMAFYLVENRSSN